MSRAYYDDPDAAYDAWVDSQADQPPQWWIDQQVEEWERQHAHEALPDEPPPAVYDDDHLDDQGRDWADYSEEAERMARRRS